jgi:hypothetical protein
LSGLGKNSSFAVLNLSPFGTVFLYKWERLQKMQTILDQPQVKENSVSGFDPSFLVIPDPENQIKKLKIKEFISWSVCFAVISVLTGLMKFMKVGVTMDSVTSIMFYGSLVGFIYFMLKIIQISKNPVQLPVRPRHGLN